MAEFEFEGFAAVGVGEELVAEADAEGGELCDELLDCGVDVVQCCRISGAVGEEEAIRFASEDIRGRGVGLNDFDFEACLAQHAELIVFQAEIDGDDFVFCFRKCFVGFVFTEGDVGECPFAGFLGPSEWFVGGDFLDEVSAFHVCGVLGGGDGVLGGEFRGDAGAHGAE